MEKTLIGILEKELKKGLGCSGAACIGFACAKAGSLIEEKVEGIELTINLNLFENSVSTIIPNTDKYGVKLAACIGVVLKNPEKQLNLFEDINDEVIREAEQLILEDKIKVKIKYCENCYIDTKIWGKKEWSKVLIRNEFTNIVREIKNGEVICEKEIKDETNKEDITNLTIAQIIDEVEKTSLEDMKIIEVAIEKNMELAKAGLREKKELDVVTGINTLIKKGIIKKDIFSKISLYVLAANEARQKGANLQIITLGGNGIQGIGAVIPVVLVGEEYGKFKEDIIKGVFISCLVTLYAKQCIGELSPLCGASLAGIGASAGMAYVLENDLEIIEKSINNAVASVVGMVCDGAKENCSFKIKMSIENALIAVLLAMEGVKISNEYGIVVDEVEESMKNLSLISLLEINKRNDDYLEKAVY